VSSTAVEITVKAKVKAAVTGDNAALINLEAQAEKQDELGNHAETGSVANKITVSAFETYDPEAFDGTSFTLTKKTGGPEGNSFTPAITGLDVFSGKSIRWFYEISGVTVSDPAELSFKIADDMGPDASVTVTNPDDVADADYKAFSTFTDYSSTDKTGHITYVGTSTTWSAADPDYTNTATISAKYEPGSCNSKTVDGTPSTSSYNVIKADMSIAPGTVCEKPIVGTDFDQSFTITNEGDVSLSDISLTATGTGATIKSITVDSGSSVSGSSTTFAGPLATSGAGRTLTVTVTAAATAEGTIKVKLTAEATKTDDLGNRAGTGDAGSETITVSAEPSYSAWELDTKYFTAVKKTSGAGVTSYTDGGVKVTGLTVTPGAPLQWWFQLLNPGSRPVEVQIADPQLSSEPLLETFASAAGTSFVTSYKDCPNCIAGSSDYTNTATFTVRSDSSIATCNSGSVTLTASSGYQQINPSVDVEKLTNGKDGPLLGPSATVTWTYAFSAADCANGLTNIVVRDRSKSAPNTWVTLYSGGKVASPLPAGISKITCSASTGSCGSTLNQGVTWTLSVTSTSLGAAAAPYLNEADVTGSCAPDVGTPKAVTDKDTSCYYGWTIGTRTPGYWANWPEVWNAATSDDGGFNKKDGMAKFDVLCSKTSTGSIVCPTPASSATICLGDFDLSGDRTVGTDEPVLFCMTVNQLRAVMPSSNTKNRGNLKDDTTGDASNQVASMMKHAGSTMLNYMAAKKSAGTGAGSGGVGQFDIITNGGLSARTALIAAANWLNSPATARVGDWGTIKGALDKFNNFHEAFPSGWSAGTCPAMPAFVAP